MISPRTKKLFSTIEALEALLPDVNELGGEEAVLNIEKVTYVLRHRLADAITPPEPRLPRVKVSAQ